MHRFRTSNQVYGSTATSSERGNVDGDTSTGVSMTEVIDLIRKTKMHPIEMSESNHLRDNVNAERGTLPTGSDETTVSSGISRKMGKGIYYPSSYEYGFKGPSAMHLPDRYFPKTNTFSNSFAGRQQRTGGLITKYTRSRVHTQFDEYS